MASQMSAVTLFYTLPPTGSELPSNYSVTTSRENNYNKMAAPMPIKLLRKCEIHTINTLASFKTDIL